ncbi:MAG: PAS domain-containing sensor histidine kinase, partial [Planctomycetota bacterium]
MYADGIFSDVTVRKVVEMSLRESQTNLALAQQIAHVGSWEWNLETGAISWSDETYRLFGFDPGQVEPT